MVQVALKMAQALDRADEHRKHVQRWLTEMYQTMGDPVEEFSGNIEQLCELLLKRARGDRETAAALDRVTALRDAADRGDGWLTAGELTRALENK